MRFEVNTVMDQKSMAAMSKAARKTLRRKRNLVIRGLGGVDRAIRNKGDCNVGGDGAYALRRRGRQRLD